MMGDGYKYSRTDNGLAALLVLFFLFVPCSSNAQSRLSGQPFVKTFPTVDFNAGIQNWVITQDRRGIVYVANNFGLLEFDGEKWQNHPVKNGTKVRSVAIDRKGRIFVGSQNEFGYFFPDNRGQLKYISLADSLEPRFRNFDEAWSIYIDQDRVFFCTFSKIYIYNGNGMEVIEATTPLDLSFFVNRKLLVNARDIGLCVLKGKAIEEMNGGSFFKGRSVSGILAHGTDSYLVSTSQDGIFVLENGTVRKWNNGNQEMFQKASINCLLRLRNGSVAAGTQNNGLVLLTPEGEIIQQLTRGKGLENRTVLSMFEDDQHNLWLGQNNGITFVELGSPFTFINEQNDLPGTGYAAYLDNDKLYLGTNTGLYARTKNGVVDFSLIENSSGQVYYIGRHGNDLLLGHHKGAFALKDKCYQISSEAGAWVFLNPSEKPDLMIEGTYNGLLLYRKINEQWKVAKKIPGFNESSRVMAEEEPGVIWVTHGYKGAYRLQLTDDYDSITSVRYYGSENGFTSNLLINVFPIRNELLFTNERGVFKYDKSNDRFVPDDLFTKLIGPSVQIWNMQEDAFGNIYYAGAESIGVLLRNSIGEYKVQQKPFSRIRRFLNDDLVNISILQNNEVLFGAKDGFIHYDPLKKEVSNANFKCLLRQVSITNAGDSVFFFGTFSNGSEIVDHQVEKNVDLPYENNSLHFYFSSPGYEGSAEKSYQFYLEPYEKSWSDFSAQTQKEYTNLKEGTYTFHVRGRNDNAQLSSETAFTFTVLPPWYRSVFAYVTYFLALIGLLFAAFLVLDKKYQLEQKAMAERQQMELEEKNTVIEKISIESKEEITRLKNEKLEADLQHMNNELATATMHLLNKNEFISDVKAQLNQIIKKNEGGTYEQELVKITKDIERNISADSDWEHFQFHFDRVHGDFTKRFKAMFPALTPQEIKLSAYLRMNLSTKEIAQLLNITVRGVEISRYRLRKKLQLDRNQNLQDFILNF